jgi:hypothetical protein
MNPRVPLDEQSISKLITLYKAAGQKLTREMTSATDFGVANRQRILFNIGKILSDLDKKTGQYFNKEMEPYYKMGAEDAIKTLKDDGFPVSESFTAIDREAIKSIVNGTMTYYREAYTGIKREALRMLTQAQRERVQAILAEGRITGDTKKIIQNRIISELKDGFTVLIDRSGKRWKLDNYADMLTRTTFAKTVNEGLENRLISQGNDLVQISDHMGECRLCRPWENQILSISGKNPKYKSLEYARSKGLFHPRCRHRSLPYIGKLAEVSEVWNPNLQRYIRL